MKIKESPEQIVRRLCEKYGVSYGKWMERYFSIAIYNFRERTISKLKLLEGESIDSFEVVKFIQLLADAEKIRVCGDRDYSVEVNRALAKSLWLFLNTLLEKEKDGEYQAFYENNNGEYGLCSCIQGEPGVPEDATKIVENFKQPMSFEDCDESGNEIEVQHPYFLEPYTDEEFARILRYEKYLKQKKESRKKMTENQRLGKWVCKIIADSNNKEMLVAGEDGKGKLLSKPNELDGVTPTNKYCFIGDLLFEAGFVEKHNRLGWENLTNQEKQREVRDWENSYRNKFRKK